MSPSKLKRVNRFLRRSRKHRHWSLSKGVTDHRSRRGRRWSLEALLGALFVGMLVASKTLRAVEDLTLMMICVGTRGFGFNRRAPDSTLDRVVRKLEPEELRGRLVAQVHSLHRSKSLQECGLPIRLVAIDGKVIWTGKFKVHPMCQRVQQKDRPPYWWLRVLRAVLVSSPTKVCIDQMAVPPSTNEMGVFLEFWQALMEAYGRSDLFEAVSLDAGFLSDGICARIDRDGKGYILRLKSNQPDFLQEAQRHFEERLDPVNGRKSEAPEAHTDWECYQGRKIMRQVWRTEELAGWKGWKHVRQVWLVKQTTEYQDGRREIEDRYFLTNLVKGRLNGQGILSVVRAHWAIENNAHWTADVQWEEDSRAWCHRGNALLALSLLRMMAYNVVQVLFARHLRSDRYRHMTWQQRFERVELALKLPRQARHGTNQAVTTNS